MIWAKDKVLAVIKIEMVTEALEVDQCAEWEEKVAQEKPLEEHQCVRDK